jgi:hypothetical protein
MLDFFDFETLVTPTLLRVGFFLLTWVLLLGSLVMIGLGVVRRDPVYVLLGVFVPFAILPLRLAFESVMVLFGIWARLGDIREDVAYATNRYGGEAEVIGGEG